jgi:hypothetical protein
VHPGVELCEGHPLIWAVGVSGGQPCEILIPNSVSGRLPGDVVSVPTVIFLSCCRRKLESLNGTTRDASLLFVFLLFLSCPRCEVNGPCPSPGSPGVLEREGAVAGDTGRRGFWLGKVQPARVYQLLEQAGKVTMSQRWETPAFGFPRVPRRGWTLGGAPEPLVKLLPPAPTGLATSTRRGCSARAQVLRLGTAMPLGAMRWPRLRAAPCGPVATGARFEIPHFLDKKCVWFLD